MRRRPAVTPNREWIEIKRNRWVLVPLGSSAPEPRKDVSLYPYTSDALGCTPEQAPVETEFAKRNGVDVEYTPNGEAVITSARQRDRLMSIYGIGSGMKTGRRK
jgi:hypothetical protein